MIRRLMGRPSRLLPLIFALTAWPAAARAQPGPVTLTANPSRICLEPGAAAYPNFDLVVRNSSNTELTVGEVRGIVLGADGEMIERRLIWQGATALLAPDNRVAARGEATIFNPFAFSRWKAGLSLRYEIDVTGPGASPITAVLTVTPRPARTPA